jgi:hypothetical protein
VLWPLVLKVDEADHEQEGTTPPEQSFTTGIKQFVVIKEGSSFCTCMLVMKPMDQIMSTDTTSQTNHYL